MKVRGSNLEIISMLNSETLVEMGGEGGGVIYFKGNGVSVIFMRGKWGVEVGGRGKLILSCKTTVVVKLS